MFILNVLALIVAIAGAINTGLVGFFNYNFLNMIFGGEVAGTYPVLTRIVFAIIGLGGVWALSFFAKPALFKDSK
ncbi:DUF378 domain-containing protein [bacterium]|nr:DUF378 domain-containing protein [bacterium]